MWHLLLFLTSPLIESVIVSKPSILYRTPPPEANGDSVPTNKCAPSLLKVKLCGVPTTPPRLTAGELLSFLPEEINDQSAGVLEKSRACLVIHISLSKPTTNFACILSDTLMLCPGFSIN